MQGGNAKTGINGDCSAVAISREGEILLTDVRYR